MGDSYILNNLLYNEKGERTDYNIQVAISEGRRTQKEGTPLAKLTYGERVMYEINNNLKNIYYTLLPADASTEWGIQVRNVVSASRFFKGDRESTMEEYYQIMWKALKNEVALAQDFSTNPTRNSIAALNQKEGNRKTGESLRFFKGALSLDFVTAINKIIDEKGQLSEDQYAKFKEEFRMFVYKRASATVTNLRGYKMINTGKDELNEIAGMDTDFLKSTFGKTKITQEQLRDLFFYREANYVFQNIEMHKFLFNDPAQYKDEEKRVKSFLSGREPSNQSEALNKVNDTYLNRSGDYVLSPNEYGYKIHSNKINVQTIDDVKSRSANIEEIQKALPGAAGKKYNDNDVADAQSWADGSTYVEMLYKAGGRLTEGQIKLHQWLMAWQRDDMFKDGLLKEEEYSKELQKADQSLLKQRIPDEVMHILKPIASGVRMENGVAVQYLYKTSTAPLYYYFVKGTPAADILLSMQKNNIGMLAMKSAHKVGLINGKIPSLYNQEGKISEEFSNSSVQIDYKYFGIQVETGGTKDYQTQGSQLTKLAVQNLMSNGVPISFKGSKEAWDALSEEEKDKNEMYSLVKKHNAILSEMVVRRSQKLLDKLGIKKNEFGYTYEDRKKVADFILSELTRRELPTNMGIGIEVENNKFKSPLEANVNYRKIKELMWSVIENNITKPKVSGGPKILLSALGYENYKTEMVNGKPVLTSTKYKFYTQKDGKTQACQIAIPFFFGTKILSRIEKSQGFKFESQKEGMKHVLDYLNNTKEGKELLEGIGFRIPTQGLNSADFFEVVEFLPPQMGDAVIFPSEITTKAGSDFDIDKMSMYLKNYYLDVNGYPKAIPYYGMDSKAYDKIKEHSLEALLAIPVKANENALDSVSQEEDNSVEEMFIKSLENGYYITLKDILSLEANFARLITPNSAKQLQDISKDIQDIKGKTDKYALTNSTRLMDSEYMSNKRHLFLIMKQAVGVAAVANTNLALNQLANFRVTIPYLLAKANFAIRFKYNKTLDGTLSLSGTTNQFGDWISDLMSQSIDGTVDVAKDEWLANLLGDASAFPVLLYMFKLGISPNTASLYINQPAIQEYLKLKGIHNNVSKMAKWVQRVYPSRIVGDIRAGYNISTKEFKKALNVRPTIYSDASMKEALKGVTTKEQKLQQLQMLADFRGFETLSKGLFVAIQGSNYDTSRFTSPEIVEDKKLQYQAAVNLDTIKGQTNKILDSSFLGTVKDAVEETNKALSGLLNTQKGDAKRMLNKLAVKFSTQFFSRDHKTKYLQRAEASMIDYLSQTQIEFGGFELNQLIPSLFLKEGNVAQMVKAAKEHPLLLDNPILANIEPIEDKRENYPSIIKLKEQDYDSYTSNVWTASFRELRDSNVMVNVGGKERTMSSIYKAMMLSQILQYGSSRTRDSFLHLIPNEDYTELVGPILENIEGVADWYQKDLFYLNNWNDSILVPEAEMDENPLDQSEILPTLGSPILTKFLKDNNYNTTFIKQPTENAKNPYLKTITYRRDEFGKIKDITDKIISLYRRVDIDENTPIYVKKVDPITGFKQDVAVYVRVQKLGSDVLKEYRDTSFLASNPTILSPSNDEIISHMESMGMKYTTNPLTELVSSDEFEEMEQYGPEEEEPLGEYIPEGEDLPEGGFGLQEESKIEDKKVKKPKKTKDIVDALSKKKIIKKDCK